MENERVNQCIPDGRVKVRPVCLKRGARYAGMAKRGARYAGLEKRGARYAGLAGHLLEV